MLHDPDWYLDPFVPWGQDTVLSSLSKDRVPVTGFRLSPE